MSDFQSRFMKIVESANTANTALAERYKEDSVKVTDDLCRELSELQNVEAHMAELTDKSRLRQYFDGLTSRYDTGLKKYTLEFTEEVTETFKSYDKRLKNLFNDEGVSGKDIYEHIDNNSEGVYSSFTSKANNIHIESNILSVVQSKISGCAEEIIKKSNLKRNLLGIVAPALLITLVIFGIKIASDYASNSVRESASTAVSGIGIDEQTADAIVDVGMEIAGGLAGAGTAVSKLPLYLVITLVVIAVWLIFYTILARSAKRKLHLELEQDIKVICQDFINRRSELQDAYAAWLGAHLSDMNTGYFMKFKPLINTVVNQEGR